MPPLRLSPIKRLGYLLAACFYLGLGGFGLRAFWRLGLGETWRTAVITILGALACGVFVVAGIWTLLRVIHGEPDSPRF